MNNRFNFTTILGCLIMLGIYTSASAQNIFVSGGLGLSIPQDHAGVGGLKGGPSTEFNVLYHFNDYFGMGIIHTSSYHTSSGRRGLGFKDFRLRFTGVKAQCKLRDSGLIPYVALSLGAKRLRSPKYVFTDTEGNITSTDQYNAHAISIVPEVGLIYGNFFASTQYSVPTIIEVQEFTSKKLLGSLDFKVGYRCSIDLRRS